MTEQILRAPGFYPREIEKVAQKTQPSGVPYGIIGPSERGRAFLPVTLGSPEDFDSRFVDTGEMRYPVMYAAQEVLASLKALTFMRVLGGGSNTTTAHFETTRTTGMVRNAGMYVSGTSVTGDVGRYSGAVQFLVAKHKVASGELLGYPMFSDNSSYTMTSNFTYLVRAMLMTTSDARFMVTDTNESFTPLVDDAAQLNDTSTDPMYRKFKLVLSSSSGAAFATTDGLAGIKVMTASLDPSSPDYLGKILNTDPTRFETEKHYLYSHFPVDAEIATIHSGAFGADAICIASGSANSSLTSGDPTMPFRNAYGHFDTRYTTARTPMFISQPFGTQEHDLFYLEAIDDGEYPNNRIKASIRNLKASNDPRNEYGTFSLIIRDFNDTDYSPMVLEQFHNLTLNPDSDSFIGKMIGDMKVSFNFDAEDPEDRRLVIAGKYPNRSTYCRVSTTAAVDRKMIPATTLPFGFRGIPVVNTNTRLVDTTSDVIPTRLAISGGSPSPVGLDVNISGSIVPPLPFRFKVTRGTIGSAGNFTGEPGPQEVVDSRLYWGVKFERNTNITNPNVSSERNEIVESLTKLQGLSLLDTVVTGSGADTFNDNKFTLSRVALSTTSFATLTASADMHIKEAAYIRNGAPSPSDSRITDGSWGSRVTLGTLVRSSSIDFNRFSDYAKFTTIFYGGWDGVNIFDKHARRFDDRATSTESGSKGYGGAHPSYTSPGATTGVNYSGAGNTNSTINSYATAINLMTDKMVFDGNLLAIPGQREPFVVDNMMDYVKRVHQLCFCIGDIPNYDPNGIRVFDGDNVVVDVNKTADTLDGRTIDNDASAVYFPNFAMTDTRTGRNVVVPASVAALAAFAFNDKVAYPWWVAAGLNRAALNFVKLTQTRIKVSDQNRLFDSRINPIVKLPGEDRDRNTGFAIMDQKTLKQGQSALTSSNIKRMLIEAKRQITVASMKTEIIWEQITPDLRQRFVNMATTLLSSIQARQGIKQFKVICDNTNNSQADARAKKINGTILIMPMYATEYIVLDFIVLPSGVSFTE